MYTAVDAVVVPDAQSPAGLVYNSDIFSWGMRMR